MLYVYAHLLVSSLSACFRANLQQQYYLRPFCLCEASRLLFVFTYSSILFRSSFELPKQT